MHQSQRPARLAIRRCRKPRECGFIVAVRNDGHAALAKYLRVLFGVSVHGAGGREHDPVRAGQHALFAASLRSD
jgi:hypothetical protein